jgi:hypothetical protein
MVATWTKYGTHFALSMPKVTPIDKKPNLIAPDLLADDLKLCRASLENAHKRKTPSRRNTLNPQSTKRQNHDFLTKSKGPTAGVTGGLPRTNPPNGQNVRQEKPP